MGACPLDDEDGLEGACNQHILVHESPHGSHPQFGLSLGHLQNYVVQLVHALVESDGEQFGLSILQILLGRAPRKEYPVVERSFEAYYMVS